jgi:hypothetical protein
MRIEKRAIVVAMVLLAGCAHESGKQPLIRAHDNANQTQSRQSRLELLVTTDCLPCHDGDTKRIDLRGPLGWSQQLALRAALLVAAGAMPPRAPLAEAERRELIAELCRSGSSDPRTCIDSYAPPPATVFARAPDELLRAINEIEAKPATPPAEDPAESILGSLIPPYVRAVPLTATVQLLVGLIATERCPVPTTQLAASLAQYDNCFAQLLRPQLLQALPPPRAR